MKTIELNRGFKCLVDDEDYALVSPYRWSVREKNGLFYAVRAGWVNGKHRMIRMHRMIMNAADGELVDHIDGNGLNNQRSNMRLCKNAQNLHNMVPHRDKKTSIYKGVIYDKSRGKYRAEICINRKRIHLGRFLDEADAARAYDKAAAQHFGEFARRNINE